MSVINTEIKPFRATAYQNGEFIEVTDADLKGKWSVVVFYPADFTFVCPTELEDLAVNYDEFKKIGVEIYSVSTDNNLSPQACPEPTASTRTQQKHQTRQPTPEHTPKHTHLP